MTDNDRVEVTQTEALKFIEHAMRNWGDPVFSTDDLEDFRKALEDFANRHRLAAESQAAPDDSDRLASVWVQWSDDGRNIRRWQRSPFDGGQEITALIIKQDQSAPDAKQDRSGLVAELLERFNQMLAQKENADTCTTYSGKVQEIGALFCDNRDVVRAALSPAPDERDALLRDVRPYVECKDWTANGRAMLARIDAIIGDDHG